MIACLVSALVATGPDTGEAASARAPKPPAPKVTKVGPGQGPSAGGTKVTIKGKHLATARKVTFGGSKGTKLTVKNDHKLTVVTPAHAAGAVDVRVKTKGGTSPSSKDARFTFVAPPGPPAPPSGQPTVTALAPAGSSTSGGARVTVTGSGFTSATSVTFGGVAGTSLAVQSPTRLLVTAPAHVAGDVDLVVTGPLGSSATGPASRFSYLTPPVGVVAPVPGGADPAFADVNLRDVTCPAPGQCFAVGYFAKPGIVFAPLVEKLAGGTWSAADVPMPAGADEGSLSAISCPTTAFCVALGSYYDGPFPHWFTATWDGTDWAAAALALPDDASDIFSQGFEDLSCGSNTSCAAVGSYFTPDQDVQPVVARLTQGTWTTEVAPVPVGAAGGELFDVDCAAASACTAVGDFWVDGPDQSPYAVSLSGTTWTAAAPPLPAGARTSPPGSGLNAVDCAAATSCTAVGWFVDSAENTHGLAEVAGPAAWQSVVVPEPSPADPFSQLFDVSCSGPGSCTAIGFFSTPTDNSGRSESAAIVGTGAASVEVTSPEGGLATLNELDCASTGGCAAVGFTSGLNGGVAATIHGFTFVSQHVAIPPGNNAGAQLTGVAGDSPTSAVGIGYMVGVPGSTGGVLVTGIAR